MKTVRRERPEWFLIPIILVLGLLSVIVAGQLALRFSPSWILKTDMESRIDPNSAYLTRRPGGFIEPVDASILTQPGWVDFLTPGVSIITGTPFPTLGATTSTSSPASTATAASATYTAVVTTSPPTPLCSFLPRRLPHQSGSPQRRVLRQLSPTHRRSLHSLLYLDPHLHQPPRRQLHP